jgi:hypothetical protein
VCEKDDLMTEYCHQYRAIRQLKLVEDIIIILILDHYSKKETLGKDL